MKRNWLHPFSAWNSISRELVLLIGVFCLLLLSACVPQSSPRSILTEPERLEPIPAFSETDCTLFQIAPADDHVCGLVRVPADHFDSNNEEHFSIPVVIKKANAEEQQRDAVVYLPDGPGDAVLGSAGTLTIAIFGHQPRNRDIVWMEPRGRVLRSGDLGCWEDLRRFQQQAFAQSLSSDTYSDGFFEALATCLRRAQTEGVDLSLFTTAQNAADIVSIAQALGYKQINLYGTGYGGRLALEVIKQSAQTDLVRSAWLTSPYGPEANLLDWSSTFQVQLERFFDSCEKDAALCVYNE